MNPFLVLAIVLGASAIAIGILVLLRRRQPEAGGSIPAGRAGCSARRAARSR